MKPIDLLAHQVLADGVSSVNERLLASEVLRLRLQNQRLEHRNAQLEVQHSFAFEQWKAAVQRGGRLSGELEHTRTELARASTDLKICREVVQRSSSRDLDELIENIAPPTVVAPYTIALQERAAPKTVVVARRPPPIPEAAYRMPPTIVFRAPPRRKSSAG